MKTVIDELDFLKKQLLFNETSQKKDLSLFATRLIKKNT